MINFKISIYSKTIKKFNLLDECLLFPIWDFGNFIMNLTK